MLVSSDDQRTKKHLKARRAAQISLLAALAFVYYFCIIIEDNESLNDTSGSRRALSPSTVRENKQNARKQRRLNAAAEHINKQLSLSEQMAHTKEAFDEYEKEHEQLNDLVVSDAETDNLSLTEKIEEAQKILDEYDSIQQQSNTRSFMPAQDILQSEWCTAPSEPPLPYDKCRWDSMVMRFGVYGGLTNALHFILKGAIWAMEEDVCFFVTETNGKYGVSKLANREPPEESVNPFLQRYFEPIGLPENHNKVTKAMKWGEIFEPSYKQIQVHEYGKRSAGIAEHDSPYRSKHKRRDLDYLNLWNVGNVWLKKHVMRRLLRILPDRREESCSRLKQYGLDGKYIALSVRRGDKVLEFELESSMKPYIDAVEEATQTHFDGTVPTIFVASDDCSVMQELREMKPDWTFVSECDKMDSHGFIISEMKHWTLKETDDHYAKFLTELIAMATATYFIGVKTTNVSLFVYFMRHYDQEDDSWKFVDAQNEFVF